MPREAPTEPVDMPARKTAPWTPLRGAHMPTGPTASLSFFTLSQTERMINPGRTSLTAYEADLFKCHGQMKTLQGVL